MKKKSQLFKRQCSWLVLFFLIFNLIFPNPAVMADNALFVDPNTTLLPVVSPDQNPVELETLDYFDPTSISFFTSGPLSTATSVTQSTSTQGTSGSISLDIFFQAEIIRISKELNVNTILPVQIPQQVEITLTQLEQVTLPAELTSSPVFAITSAQLRDLPPIAVRDRASAIIDIYRTHLLRAPDAAGFNAWFNSKLTPAQIGVQILNSPESKNLRLAMIPLMYQAFLNRTPSNQEVLAWANTTHSLDIIRKYILRTHESSLLRQALVMQFYSMYFNRAPSKMEVWNARDSFLTLHEIRLNLFNSPEARKLRVLLVTQWYKAYLNREATPKELLDWLVANRTLHEIRLSILKSPEARVVRERMVREWFLAFLGRSITNQELTYWFNLDGTLHNIRVTIFQSNESRDIRTRLLTEWTKAFLGRTPTNEELSLVLGTEWTLHQIYLRTASHSEINLQRVDRIKIWFKSYLSRNPSQQEINLFLNSTGSTLEEILIKIITTRESVDLRVKKIAWWAENLKIRMTREDLWVLVDSRLTIEEINAFFIKIRDQIKQEVPVFDVSKKERQETVVIFYQEYLRRLPTEKELRDLVDGNLTLEKIRIFIFKSEESLRLRESFLGPFFIEFLNRDPRDRNEVLSYVNLDLTLQQLRIKFTQLDESVKLRNKLIMWTFRELAEREATTEEYRILTASLFNLDQIKEFIAELLTSESLKRHLLFLDLVKRPPTKEELRLSLTLEQYRQKIVLTEEYRVIVVTELYQRILFQFPTPAVLRSWVKCNLSIEEIKQALLTRP